jgi:uncharacterized glyoxalase superfamily protein PhnB
MSNPTIDTALAPHLIVKGAARAIAFYVEALGARELSRATDHKLGDLIVHAELAIGAAHFSLSGKRQGRLRDPFGHLWIISQELEALSPEEVQRRVDAFHDGR